jgi:hypothetical protein
MRIHSFWLELLLNNQTRWSALLFGAVLGLSFLAAVPADAITRSTPAKRARNKYSSRSFRNFRSFRLVKWNPVFAGSHELLVRQNVEIDRLQLPRINDEIELMNYELSLDLVPVSESEALKIATDLPENRRYCRPWTRDFLEDFSQAFYNEFGTPLQVNSLVRTVEQQRRLRRYNRFAAPEIGDTASTHLTGVTVDLSRRGLTQAQYKWIRDYLMPLHEAGLVEPIEERQPVLHVVVNQRYSAHDSESLYLTGVKEPATPSVAPDFGLSAWSSANAR